jgi:LmbE family N-acetylglucosaminyl deacetylase
MKSINIVLSPHHDDAVLSLGGLLAREGASSIVATFFAGAPATALRTAWDVDCGLTDSTEAFRIRAEENRRALGRLGLPEANIRDYAYLNEEYRTVAPVGEQELETALTKDIAALVEENRRAALVRIFAPGLERHRDHALVKQALLGYLRQSGRENLTGFLYQDLPYAHWMVEQTHPPDFRALDQAMTQGNVALAREIIPLTEGEMTRKLRAVRSYRSQLRLLASIGKKNFLDRLLGRKGLGKIPGIGAWRLTGKIRTFAARQAKVLDAQAGYCEVVYKVGDADRAARP